MGRVGTPAWILLLEAEGGEEWLFLQAKGAQESVLAGYAGRSRLANHCQRVVVGQQLMQAVSDIFLGWQRTTGADGVDRDHYVRQLRDWKFSAPIERMIPSGMQHRHDRRPQQRTSTGSPTRPAVRRVSPCVFCPAPTAPGRRRSGA